MNNNYFPSSVNQSGEQTPVQRGLLTRALFSSGCLSVVLVGFGGAFLIPMLVGVLTDDLSASDWIPMLIFLAVAVGIGLGGLWAAWRFMLLLLDFLSKTVEQGEGQIVWARGSYKAKVQGRRMSLISGLMLAPGTYRMYTLPRSGLVVGGDKLGASFSAREELQNALAQSNGFSAEKLAEYRLGRMGDERYGRLAKTWIWSSLGLLALLALMGFIVWGVFTDTDAPWFMLLFFGAFVFLFVAIIAWNLVQSTQDLLAGEVASAEGFVRRTVHRSNKSTSYYYKLDKLSFSVSGTAYNALVEGLRYRVYYLPRSKKLLGIEPLDNV